MPLYLVAIGICSTLAVAIADEPYGLVNKCHDGSSLLQVKVSTAGGHSTASESEASSTNKPFDPRGELAQLRNMLDDLLAISCDATLAAVWTDLSYCAPAQIVNTYLKSSTPGQCSGRSILVRPSNPGVVPWQQGKQEQDWNDFTAHFGVTYKPIGPRVPNIIWHRSAKPYSIPVVVQPPSSSTGTAGTEPLSFARSTSMNSTDSSTDSSTTSPALGSNITIADVYAIHKTKFSFTWVHAINLAVTLFMICLCLYLLFYCSPLNGYAVDIDRHSGETQPTAMRSYLVTVCLPFWFPVDKKDLFRTKLLAFIDVACIFVSSAATGFLWVMLELKLAISLEPDLGDALVDGGMNTTLYLGRSMFFVSGFGSLCWPLCYWLLRSKLRGKELQHMTLWLFFTFMFKGIWGGIPASFIGRGMAMWIPGRMADKYWHWQRTYMIYTIVTDFFLGVGSDFLGTYLGIVWGRYETFRYLSMWMSHRAYYRLNTDSGLYGQTDNPDLRIQADVGTMTGTVVGFVSSIVTTILSCLMTLQITWLLAPKWTLYGLIYTCFGLFFDLWFMWQFVRLSYMGEMFGGDYRHALINIRNHAEAIAFYGGEDAEMKRIKHRYERTLDNALRGMYWSLLRELYGLFYGIGRSTIPGIFMLRGYFQNKIDLGGYGQMSGSYGSFVGQVNLIGSLGGGIVPLSTAITRLGALEEAIDRIGSLDATLHQDGYMRTKFADKPIFMAINVTVESPVRSISLVNDLNFELGGAGQPRRLLIVGPSGVGKSSLLRGLTGLWSKGSGEIVRPGNAKCIFLPQTPYMPLGTLRDQLTYPSVSSFALKDNTDVNVFRLLSSDDNDHSSSKRDSEIHDLLGKLRLEDLPSRFADGLDHVEDWYRVFSKGEQQRVAVVRGMLNELSLVILDEATSALSADDEDVIYSHYVELDVPVISVGHRESLVKYHDSVLQLFNGGGYKMWHNTEEYLTSAERPKPGDAGAETNE